MKRILQLAVAGLTIMAAGCGNGNTSDEPARQVRLILDYLPNAVHVGLYQSEAAGYFRDEGLNVKIEAPTSSSDTLRLMAAGQADFGIVSLMDFLSVRAKGEPVKIVMAIEQRPLGAVIALKKSHIERPRDLAGRLVGITGVLSDEAGVRWMVQRDGGDPAAVRLINIGFNTAQQVVAGNVDAAFGFWTDEGVQVAANGPATLLRLDDYGAPLYPELIVFAREDYLAAHADLARSFLRAVSRGYQDAISNPDGACAAMAARVEGETAAGLKPYLDAIRPLFRADAPEFGWLNLSVLRDYLGWIRQIGALDVREDPSKFATNEFLPPLSAGQGTKQ